MSKGAQDAPRRDDAKRGRGRRRRGTAPGAAAEPRVKAADPSAAAPDVPPLDGPPGVVLERLRDRIRDVVREIDGLRAENQRLTQQVVTLQQQADAGDPALLRLDESPEMLRSKVEGFIEALDAYLEGEAH